MRPLETFIEQRKERFVRNSLMSDEFLDFVNKNMKPIEKQMSYYQCAIMEVETTATRLKTSNPVSNPWKA